MIHSSVLQMAILLVILCGSSAKVTSRVAWAKASILDSRSLLKCARCNRKPHSSKAEELLNPLHLTKDVILYKYDNQRYYRNLTIFGGAQFLFWGWLAYMSLNPLSFEGSADGDSEPASSLSAPSGAADKFNNHWLVKFSRKFADLNLQGYLFFCIGYGCLGITWLMSLRAVRLLVLRKGGRDVSLVTYAPFGTSRITTVPLSLVSCKKHRGLFASQVPIKVRGRPFHFILDKRGSFLRPDLFDMTIGLKKA